VSSPTGFFAAIPSRLGAGERFALKVRVLGPVYEVGCAGAWNTWKPGLKGPFNLNVHRGIRYMDNCLPEWTGRLKLDGGGALAGGGEVVFDGKNQGAFPGDVRPVRVLGGLSWTEPGFHFIKVVDAESGVEGWTNPVLVTEEPPVERIWWGDPHWQTFFSDGIRCPEELYAFARDEGFLDFGAISDHMEGVTDAQWDYFQRVTEEYYQPGSFVTLHGQEWTHHDPERGAPGHRNVYYRGGGGPVLRSTDPDCDTLEKLWRKLDAAGLEALAIPHHSANRVMGVDWDLGWNPKYERAVEIYSVWGSSERHADAGNTRPGGVENLGGEVKGRHVVDALKRGYRFGFVAGGDVHDGRPGDAMHDRSYPPRDHVPYEQGLTAALAPELTREAIFDAMAGGRTYAATHSRIHLDARIDPRAGRLELAAASEEGIEQAVLCRSGEDALVLMPDEDARVVTRTEKIEPLAPEEFCYVRVTTGGGNLAWSSPVWGGCAGGSRE
jgi:hypothetical protein